MDIAWRQCSNPRKSASRFRRTEIGQIRQNHEAWCAARHSKKEPDDTGARLPNKFSPAICSQCFTPCWVRGFPAPHVCGKPLPALRIAGARFRLAIGRVLYYNISQPFARGAGGHMPDRAESVRCLACRGWALCDGAP